MKKNRIYKNIKVEKVGYGGIGIGILENGKKIMIRGGILPNSVVDCRVTKQRKDFIEAEVIEVVSFDQNWASEKPLCSHFNNPLIKTGAENAHKVGCGGCKWQMTSYTHQLEIKENLILDSFRSNQSILEHAPLLPIIPSPQQYHYRNKIEFSFGKYITGKKSSGEDNESNDEEVVNYINHNWQLGFHKQGQFSKILDVDQCFLISQKLHNVYTYCKNLLKASNLSTYDQKTHIGFFRHLAMREGIHTGHILVNLVVATDKLISEQQKNDRETLHTTIKNDVFLKKNVKTFIVTGNNGLADIVKGRDSSSEIVFGDGTIYENLVFSPSVFNKKEMIYEDEEVTKEGVSASFRISPFSFFQTNTLGTEVLFGTAAALVGEVKGTILDLYCGAGTIGISFLKMGKGDNVVGIEIVEEAIYDAKFNAEINGCQDDTYFVAGKAEDLIYKDKKVQEKLTSLGLIIIDPPRCGLHKNVITFINELRAHYKGKLLYISCNPVTLARDLELFEQGGWKTKLLQPVDMFPHTHHIETIAILQ